jgi:hypothetical protein
MRAGLPARGERGLYETCLSRDTCSFNDYEEAGALDWLVFIWDPIRQIRLRKSVTHIWRSSETAPERSSYAIRRPAIRWVSVMRGRLGAFARGHSGARSVEASQDTSLEGFERGQLNGGRQMPDRAREVNNHRARDAFRQCAGAVEERELRCWRLKRLMLECEQQGLWRSLAVFIRCARCWPAVSIYAPGRSTT